MRTRKAFGLLAVGALALSVAAVLSVTLGPHDLAGTAQAQGDTALALDMNVDNGSGPCNPIDATRGVNVGDTYQVAVCLTDSALPPAAFQFDLVYDQTIDQCVPSDCTGTACLDGNPDANAGATTWGGTSLGDGWDCNLGGVSPPACNKSADLAGNPVSGAVSLQCLSVKPPALNVGEGVSAAIAVVTFKSIATGTDTFGFGQAVEVDQRSAAKMVDCESFGSCAGGSVAIAAAGALTPTPAGTATAAEPTSAAATAAAIGPTATAAAATAAAAAATAVSQGTPISAINDAATATAAAVATKAATAAKSTPGGKATAKPTAAAGEGGGSSGPNAGLIAAIVVGAVIVVGGVGWFAWRRLRAG